MLKDKYNVQVYVFKTCDESDEHSRNEYGIIEEPVLLATTNGRLIAHSTELEIDGNLKTEIRYFNLYTPIGDWCYEQDIFFVINDRKFHIKSPTQIYKNSTKTEHAETLVKYINNGKREDLQYVAQ